MPSTNITNKHDDALTVGGVTIQSGRTAAVPDFDIASQPEPIATWVKLGLLVDADAKPAAEEPKGKAKD